MGRKNAAAGGVVLCLQRFHDDGKLVDTLRTVNSVCYTLLKWSVAYFLRVRLCVCSKARHA